jgi:hypothetical protein
MRTLKTAPRLRVERLEDRLTPAATVGIVDGALVVRGTDAAERFLIDIQSGGTIRVQGQDCTTFNGGQTVAMFASSAAPNGIIARLAGGADGLVARSQSSARRNLDLAAGDGHDTIVLGNFTVGEANLNAGRGNDRLTLEAVTLEGHTAWRLGEGDDTVTLKAVEATANNVWTTGAGADVVSLSDDTRLVDSVWSLGLGNDIFNMEDSMIRNGRMTAGAGSDLVLLTNAITEGSCVWQLGLGADVVVARGSTLSEGMQLAGGAGHDALLDLGGNTLDPDEFTSIALR